MDINTCPQCQKNLPLRLKSGRLICKSCGWSDTEKILINNNKSFKETIFKTCKENPALPLLTLFLIIMVPVAISQQPTEGSYNIFNSFSGFLRFLSSSGNSSNSINPEYKGETKCTENGCTVTDENDKVLIKNECKYDDNKLICKNYSNY